MPRRERKRMLTVMGKHLKRSYLDRWMRSSSSVADSQDFLDFLDPQNPQDFFDSQDFQDFLDFQDV